MPKWWYSDYMKLIIYDYSHQIERNCMEEINTDQDDDEDDDTEQYEAVSPGRIIECLKRSFSKLKNSQCKKVCISVVISLIQYCHLTFNWFGLLVCSLLLKE